MRRARLARSGLALRAVLVSARELRRRAGHRGDLQGQVVLITGAPRGLGLEMARVLAPRGARLALCARNQTELEGGREELQEVGAEVVTSVCDVGDATAVKDMVSDVSKRLGPVDVLIANAGVMTVGPVESLTREDSRRRWT